MQTVTVSPKYQVVIPKEIRDILQLKPGQKMRVMEFEGRIEMIPDRDISELKGYLRGINTDIQREKDRL
ncbi:MAG: AbrB/MazE/SpoVT family DNA-binding domain-containing protein [Deltaproteobacteria bacterium]|nr:AbrB/MazE/SpoVT family DNA-binding domain-containing protein [Deltaproteobacteria bacterium]MBW2677824.1 AbrB/MazE/SpoVT family DNA-binding domain-containing protein [Deltaproteobacteria bacterium]